ncbi:PREDICTED: uncharacterized protein LOC105556986 [Vollenhovia emeryi]|uniref:uncharacterized protein LOC105556986 n=1 Tax=Vollenhovia emeryi TaxID=411798 RepID=UPI0005F4A47A|nr:PREDICTED: uncharacterized protein LOC105556986 [Vollenhovia emeryi]
MASINKNKRGLWTEEQLQNAVTAVKETNLSVNRASLEYKIPRRTLRRILAEDGEIKKKVLGRPPVLNQKEEQNLKNRIVRLQQVGFGLKRQDFKKCVFQYCEEMGIEHPFKIEKEEAGKDWLKGFMMRNPDIVLRSSENLSYGRLMRFNKEIVRDFYDLLGRTMDELDLHNNPQLIYNVDESGLQLSYSNKFKVLALKGSKRVHTATHAEKGETVTVVACTNATGSNWIPPIILYKGVHRKLEFGDGLPPGSKFAMTPKGYITKEEFCNFLTHFNQHRIPGKCLLILDGHRTHLDFSVLEQARNYNIEILCLPAHCSHELQPLDKSCFKPLKHYWNEALDNYRRSHPGRSVSKYQFPVLFNQAWMKTSTAINAVSGFRATGIFPYNPNAIPNVAFAPSSISDRPQQENSEINNVPETDENTSGLIARLTTPTPTPPHSADTFQTLLLTPDIKRKSTTLSKRSLNVKAKVVTKLFDELQTEIIQPATPGSSGTQKKFKKKKKGELYCGDCGGYFYDKKMKERSVIGYNVVNALHGSMKHVMEEILQKLGSV